jgi:hypothetical protein
VRNDGVVNTFFSDRVNGPVPRTDSTLPVGTANGLVSLVTGKIAQDWFASAFPLKCEDGNGVAGTDEDGLTDNMCALIPRLRVPLNLNGAAPADDDVVFDLLEYSAHRVVGIRSRKFHSYWRHDDLSFDGSVGPAEFRAEVNEMLGRGGVAYEMNSDGEIRRLGSRELRQAVDRLPVSGTGDAELEILFEQSRRYYFSRKADERQIALEKLWDAFERVKTIDTQRGSKKIGVSAILGRIEPALLRDAVEREMRELTSLGNAFKIRHFETDKVSVPPEATDYLMTRMSALVVFLLERLGRLDLV